jgi:hypothetical protein
MSRLLPAPWLQGLALGLVESKRGGIAKKIRPRTVQVIKSNDSDNGILTINDKEHYVSVMLTPECLEAVKLAQGDLSSLNHSLVKLEQYHLSTVVWSANGRDFSRTGVSLPFAIQCNELTYLGANDCDVIGEPKDLNKDPRVREAIDKIDFATLTQRLAEGQFPRERMLPDAGACKHGVLKPRV